MTNTVIEGTVVEKPKTYSFTIQVELTAGQLSDVLSTAVEGGIQYWAIVEQWKWVDRAPEDFYAVIREDDDERKQYTLTVDTVREGLNRLVLRETKCHLPGQAEELRRMALGMLRDPEGFDYDAGDADNIIQAGLFNEITYG